MRPTTPLVSKILALSLLAAGACASTPRAAAPAAAAPQADPPRTGLQIKLTTVYVNDQDQALRFYTDVLGLVTKDDVTNGPFRWLTVTAAGDPDGGQLLLARAEDPAAKAFQEAMYKQDQPAVMFHTDDVQRDYERIKAKGGVFKMPPTDVGEAIIATVDDTTGNLIQLSQLTP